MSQHSGHLSADDDDSSRSRSSSTSSSGSSSESDGGGRGGGGAVMSIFASYYGIEETAAPQMKGTIDDANFDSETFVRGLLVQEPMEGLVMKDAEIVNDIRNLDGEMQKLVYDNYHKFITATETIKDMKNDVLSMDPDMHTVRSTLSDIGSKAQQLDAAMETSRQQVDKLVRIRRLLDRLEFLSELPEKLATMIEQRAYKDAVQLYRKSITVLTRHSHVLSFKKIKERTEAMMNDLTKKVIALLDDPSLEAIKMTQYVTVLRLMNAPTETVARTLVRAHQQRAKRLVTQYEQRVAPIIAPSAASASASAAPAAGTSGTGSGNGNGNGNGPLLTAEQAQQLLSDSREFHQLILVGAIEACKAVTELFPITSANDGAVQQREQVYRELQDLLSQMLHEYTQAITRVFRVFLTHYETAHRLRSSYDASSASTTYANEFRDVLRAQGVTGSAGVQWMKHLQAKMDEIQRLYVRTKQPTTTTTAASTTATESDAEATAEAATVTAQENQHEAVYLALQAARSAWHTLARQILSDVVFLDSHLRDCARHLHLVFAKPPPPPSSSSVLATPPPPSAATAPTAAAAAAAGTVKPLSFTTETGDVWVRLWRGHYHVMLGQHVHRYVAHLVDEWGTKALLALLTVAHPQLLDLTAPPSSSSSPSSSPPVGQRLPLFQEQLVWMQRVWTLLCDRLVETFQDALHETKPLLDLFEVTNRPIDEEHWPLVLLSEFLETLTWYCEDAVGIEDQHRLRYALETHHQAMGSGGPGAVHHHRHSGHSGSTHSGHHHRNSHSGGSTRRKDSLTGGEDATGGAAAAAAGVNSRRAILEEEEDVFAVAWYTACPVHSAAVYAAGHASAHPSHRPATAHGQRHRHHAAWLSSVGWQVPAETSLLVALLLKRLATPSATATTAFGAAGRGGGGGGRHHRRRHRRRAPRHDGDDDADGHDDDDGRDDDDSDHDDDDGHRRGHRHDSAAAAADDDNVDGGSGGRPTILSPLLTELFDQLTTHEYFPGFQLQEISLHVQARLLKHVDAAHRLCYHHFLHQNVLHAQQQTQRWLMALYQHYYALEHSGGGGSNGDSGGAIRVGHVSPLMCAYAQYIDQVSAWTYLCLGEALPGASAAASVASTPGATPTGAALGGHVNVLSGGGGGGAGAVSGGAAGGTMRRASLLPTAAVTATSAVPSVGAVGRRASLTASVSTSASLGGSLLHGGASNSSVHGSLGRALQLDLDRLFAAKVICVPNTLHVEKLSHSLFSASTSTATVTDPTDNGNGNGNGGGGVVAVSVEVIVGSILKATIKSGDELTRLLQLPSATSHTHVQQHAHFLRLLSPSLLRDPYNHSAGGNGSGSGSNGGSGGHHGALLGELDQLIDAWLRTMFSRYRGANDNDGPAAGPMAAEDDPVAFMKRAQNTLTWLAQVGTTTDDDEDEDDDNDGVGDVHEEKEQEKKVRKGSDGVVYRTLLLVR